MLNQRLLIKSFRYSAGRDSGLDAKGFGAAGYNGPRRYNAPLFNGDPFQDGGIRTNPHIAFNDNIFIVGRLLFRSRYIRHELAWYIRPVIAGNDSDMGACYHLFVNQNIGPGSP